MPERKSRRNKEQESIVTLRRSPRLRHLNQSDSKTQTPNPKPKKTQVADSFCTPLGFSISKTQKKIDVNSRKGERRIVSVKSGRVEKDRGFLKQCVVEKRVTRSSVRGSRNAESRVGGVLSDRFDVLSKEKECVCGVERRVTRSLSRKKLELDGKDSSLSMENSRRLVIESDEGKRKGDVELSERCTKGREREECGVRKVKGGAENGGRKVRIGEKRKRNDGEGECEVSRGWTKEQELALRRAYFTAKPTPHFWKKVARMVPGKSAEECFDRIHADQATPPQPRTRSMANKTKPSSLSFSASKLLSPAETKLTKLRFSKRKSLMAQKTVRQLLQKQQNEDQENETDLFSVLEQAIDRSPLNFQQGIIFSSPTPSQGSGKMSSSFRKKHFSRLSSLGTAAFVSPPVLKQVKNKALHEKYIDQLHFRDAKRKVQSLKNAKGIKGKKDKTLTDLKLNNVKLAKEALIFEAQDAINQFGILQSCITNDVEDSSSHSEDEVEDENP